MPWGSRSSGPGIQCARDLFARCPQAPRSRTATAGACPSRQESSHESRRPEAPDASSSDPACTRPRTHARHAHCRPSGVNCIDQRGAPCQSVNPARAAAKAHWDRARENARRPRSARPEAAAVIAVDRSPSTRPPRPRAGRPWRRKSSVSSTRRTSPPTRAARPHPALRPVGNDAKPGAGPRPRTLAPPRKPTGQSDAAVPGRHSVSSLGQGHAFTRDVLPV